MAQLPEYVVDVFERPRSRPHPTIDPTSHVELRLTRVFDAPRHLVLEAISNPDHVRQWWGDCTDADAWVVVSAELTVENGRTRLTATLRPHAG